LIFEGNPEKMVLEKSWGKREDQERATGSGRV